MLPRELSAGSQSGGSDGDEAVVDERGNASADRTPARTDTRISSPTLSSTARLTLGGPVDRGAAGRRSRTLSLGAWQLGLGQRLLLRGRPGGKQQLEGLSLRLV